VLFLSDERSVSFEPCSQKTSLGRRKLEVVPADLAPMKEATQEADTRHQLLRDDQRLRTPTKAAPHSDVSVMLYLPMTTPLNRCGYCVWSVLSCLREIKEP
jgi:hypothetical protein